MTIYQFYISVSYIGKDKEWKRANPIRETYNVALEKSEKRDSGTVPKMDIKRYSACSVFGRFAYSHTAPSGRSGRHKSTRSAKNQPFRLRRPLPISTQFYEWFGYLYGRFQIGICLLPFRAALRCELGFTPPFRSHNTNHLFLSRLSPLAAMNRRRCRLSGLRPKTKRLKLLGCFTWIVYPIGHASE